MEHIRFLPTRRRGAGQSAERLVPGTEILRSIRSMTCRQTGTRIREFSPRKISRRAWPIPVHNSLSDFQSSRRSLKEVLARITHWFRDANVTAISWMSEDLAVDASPADDSRGGRSGNSPPAEHHRISQVERVATGGLLGLHDRS